MPKIKLIELLGITTGILIIIGNFNCCTNTCLKRTFEWDGYIPNDYTDNTGIINSEEFKNFQLKFPVNESKIDSIAKVISPTIISWVSAYDSLFQGKNELYIKLRINSNGYIECFRILNTFKFNINRINLLNDNLKGFNCQTTLKDTMVVWEFSLKLIKDNRNIISEKSGPAYSVFKQRTAKEILKVVNTNLIPMKKAFEFELSNNLCAHGKIIVQFIIREDGTIPICKIVESTYCDTLFENKIVDFVRAWKFPKMMATFDNIEIIYPFVFNRE